MSCSAWKLNDKRKKLTLKCHNAFFLVEKSIALNKLLPSRCLPLKVKEVNNHSRRLCVQLIFPSILFLTSAPQKNRKDGILLIMIYLSAEGQKHGIKVFVRSELGWEAPFHLASWPSSSFIRTHLITSNALFCLPHFHEWSFDTDVCIPILSLQIQNEHCQLDL